MNALLSPVFSVLSVSPSTARQHRKRDKSNLQEVLLDSIVCFKYLILFICIGYAVSCSSFGLVEKLVLKWTISSQRLLAAAHERAKRDFNFANRCCHHRRIAKGSTVCEREFTCSKENCVFFPLSSAYPNLLSSFPPVVFSQLGRTGIFLSTASRNHR